nr:hypothetical protein [uncultured Prevotella sp.]
MILKWIAKNAVAQVRVRNVMVVEKQTVIPVMVMDAVQTAMAEVDGHVINVEVLEIVDDVMAQAI